MQKDDQQALQRLAVDANVSCIELRVSPWQLADMQRLAAAASWLQRRAAYAHLRPGNLDCRLGFCSCCQRSLQQSSDGDATETMAAPHSMPSWAAVWRFAVVAVRSDLKLNTHAQRAAALRGQRLRRKCRRYIAACSLLYAAKQAALKGSCTTSSGAADDKRAFTVKGAASDLQHGLAGRLNYEVLDLDFFSWLRHSAANHDTTSHGGTSSLAGSSEYAGNASTELALAALATCRHACHVVAGNSTSKSGTNGAVCLVVQLASVGQALRAQLEAACSESHTGGEGKHREPAESITLSLSLQELAQVWQG